MNNKHSKPSNHSILQVENLSKDYLGKGGIVHALIDISFQMNAGEWVALRGPSGAGKTTLINLISGIDHPSQGSITICGKQLEKMGENSLSRFRGRNIGIILQTFQLMPTLTVVQNVILPMDLCRVFSPKQRFERAMFLLQQMGLEEHARKFPSQLSGGQQQRVAIARALANDPPLLLGDEPTGSLDSKTAKSIFEIFNNLVAQGKSYLMATHDPDIEKFVSRTIYLKDGVILSSLDS